MKHGYFRPILLLLALLSVGCSSGSDSGLASTTNVTNPVPVIQTGTVRLQSVLARTVPSTVTDFRITGFDSRGTIQFGPETVSKAATVELTVPTTVITLQFEYLANGTLIGIGSTPVSITVDQITELSNIDFQDVNAALTQLLVTPSSPTIAAGTSLTLRAEGTFADQSQRDLSSSATWSSSSTGVATVNSRGQVTGVAPGTADITATFGTVSQNVTVTVTAATLTTVSVSPNPLSLGQGTTAQLTARGTFSDGTQQDITSAVSWSSSAPSNASVDTNGLVTANLAGQTDITATSGVFSGSTSVLVTEATLSQIAITPSLPSLAAGTDVQLTATGFFSDGSTQNLTSSVSWASDRTGIATVGPTGLLAGVTTGSAGITASFQGVIGQATTTVTGATLSSLNLTLSNPSIPAGTSRQFEVIATFTDGTQINVTPSATWSSNQTAQATVSSFGFARGIAPGQSTISATFDGQTASTTLTVTAATVTSVVVNPPISALASGTGTQLQAIANFSDGTQQDVTSSAAWSSGSGAASVSPAGFVQALSTGSSQITATFQGQSGTSAITVTAATVVSVEVTPDTPVLAIGTNQQMVATATLSDGSQQVVTSSASWSSSAPSVAGVDTTGLVSALSPGQSDIQATVSGVSGSTTATVTQATLTALSVSPNTLSGAAGLQQQFTAIATFSDGSQQDVTSASTWSSSSMAQVTIDPSGLAVAQTPGLATIQADFGGLSSTADFSVTAATITSVELSPTNQVLGIGLNRPFTAVATLSSGSRLNVGGSATWTSSDTSVATVDTTGSVTTLASGQTTITATVSGVSGSTTVTVTPATVRTLVVTPSFPNLPNGQRQQFTATATLTDGTVQDVTSSATWTSANTSLATVSPTGEARARADSGTVSIRATFGSASSSTDLTLQPAVLIRVLITPVSPNIANGTTRQFNAQAAFSSGVTTPVAATWTSSTPAVATVDGNGLVQALSPGQTVITGTFSGQSDSTTLTVSGPSVALQSLSIEPPLALSSPGSTRQFRAIGTFTDASTQDLSNQVVWSSNNSNVVVDNNNLGGNAEGRATIAASTPAGTTATIQAALGTHNGTSTLRIDRFAYLNQDNQTLTTYRTAADGTISQVGTPVTVGGNLDIIEIDPSGRWLYAGSGSPDNALFLFTINADGSLSANGPSVAIPPFGPRAAVFHPNGETLYVLNASNQIIRFQVGADGRLTSVGTPVSDPAANGVTDIAIHPNGRFLYVTNGFADTVSLFRLTGTDGSFSFIANYPTGDRFPEAVTVDPTGRYLYVANFSESIATFTVDDQGVLTSQGTLAIGGGVGDPADLEVDPTGRYLVAALRNSDAVVSFSIGVNGALTQISNVSVVFGLARSVRIDSTGRFVYVAEGQKKATTFSLSPAGVLTLNNSLDTPRQPEVFVPTP